MSIPSSSRRDFLKISSIGGVSALSPLKSAVQKEADFATIGDAPQTQTLPLDLSPARWIWYPMQRCLANTVILFRKEFTLKAKPIRATGYVLGDSRYLLSANGNRIQFGPAPADPRYAEADPIDLSNHLVVGKNVVGSQVLFYGHGDGTWPIGKPGFIFKIDIEMPDGQFLQVVSDATWQSYIARSWRPGQYKRWYLRAFQEEFDARLYPFGWNSPDYEFFETWPLAQELENDANKPPISNQFTEYTTDIGSFDSPTQLLERSIPLLQEELIKPKKLAESMKIMWQRSPQEYFECLPPDAYTVERTSCVISNSETSWTTNIDGIQGNLLTFEFDQQCVGFPYFTIDAPAGTIVEIMVQESHTVGGEALLNTHFNSWSRLICKSGKNTFEGFDYESFRWLQLHIHGTLGQATVSDVGVRRRQYQWPNKPQINVSDDKIQKVLNACVNTIHNSAQETIVDGMARERQQYSGDGSHQLHAIQYAFGDTQLHARFINTFGLGQTPDGYFLDTWPAYDRLARVMERQIGLTNWGPLLDHSIGFNFDCWYYYLYTGDKTPITNVYPKLLKFFNYLLKIKDKNGLLPVENLGIPSVWIDHEAYLSQRHKQCAFNIYAIGMMKVALAPICDAMADTANAALVRTKANELHAATIKAFWSVSQELFINNLPWIADEKKERLCDRSLGMAVLFDLCPNYKTKNCIDALVKIPENMGLSYPANANWRYWGLAKGGMPQPIIDDFRGRWFNMESVQQNNTIQEWWHVRSDSGHQWSHCGVAPLYHFYRDLAGIRPITAGFKKIQIRPQLGDIENLSLQAYTVQGPITFQSSGKIGNRGLIIIIPAECEGELVVPAAEDLPLEAIAMPVGSLLKKYKIKGGEEIIVTLKAV